MPAFELPLTVQAAAGRFELVVQAAGGERWADVAPAVRHRAGLAPDTPLYLGVGVPDDDWLIGSPPLLAGMVLRTVPTAPAVSAGTVVLDCVAGPDAGGSAPVGRRPMLIGRSPAADLVLADPEVSTRHARVSLGRGGATITDLLSTNGTAIGGMRSPANVPQPLTIGLLVEIGGSSLRLDLPGGSPMLRHPDAAGRWELSLPARPVTAFGHPLPDDPGPPPVRSRHPLPITASLAGAAAGITIALLTRMWIFLLMAALGPVTMIVTAVGDRLSGRRPHRRAVTEHAAASKIYRDAIAAGVSADRADAWERFADPARLLRWATVGGVRLWERRCTVDMAELEMVLSTGSRPARLTGADPPAVHHVPLPSTVPGSGMLGLCGTNRGTVRWFLAQLIGTHPPADLQMQVLSTADDIAPLRDVPHTRDGASAGCLHADPAALIGALGRADAGLRIAVIDGVERWRADPALQALLRRRAPGLLIVLIARSPVGLPAACGTVVDVDRLHGRPIGVSRGYLADLSAALTPLTVAAADGGLPRRLAAAVPTAESIASRWARGLAPRAVLGVSRSGPLAIDLAADGPHLLIAGTTGSGKSELLQTLIAGLAESLSPERLAFLLIDYKGGAAFADAAGLPHTTGTLTDLDPRLAERALRSLRAEILRREKILARAGVTDLVLLQRSGRAGVPPRLVIVVDEFATMAAELPDFLTGLVDIAQRGRSLGLHLVLATQRPAGVVSPAIKANTAARICLRVTDVADSTDVVDSPLAAMIPADLPGRGYLRTAGGRLTAFQTRQVTVATPHRVAVRMRDTAPKPSAGPVPMRALIEAVGPLADGLVLPDPPWLPTLGELIRLDEPGQLGIIDLPADQVQRPWLLPEGSLLIAGPPGSGRTSTLHRWAQGIAADSGELLVVDCGGALVGLADHPSVTTYLTEADPMLVLRLIDLLGAEAAARARGGGSVAALRHATSAQRCPVGLALDGWEALSAAVDVVDLGQWQTKIAELAGRGPAAGIRLAVAGGQRLAQHRIAQAFGSRLLLGLTDAAGDPTPGTPPGRGRLHGSDAGELQVALPVSAPSCRSQPARPAAHQLRSALAVRPLPTLVRCDALPAPIPAAVPIGLGGDAATAISVDLTGAGGGLLVAGGRRSGVSSALAVLAVGAVGAGIPTVRLLLRAAPPLPGARDLDLRVGPDPLSAFLAGHQGPLLIVGDDADHLVEHPAGELLSRYLTVAGTGQYMALGVRLDRAVRSHRGPIAETAAFRTGILLGADSLDGAVLDAALPKRRTLPPPGRGHLVISGAVQPVQLALIGAPDNGRRRPEGDYFRSAPPHG